MNNNNSISKKEQLQLDIEKYSAEFTVGFDLEFSKKAGLKFKNNEKDASKVALFTEESSDKILTFLDKTLIR